MSGMKFVKRIAGMVVLGALLLGPGPISSPAQAGYIVTYAEVGNDVIATGSGALDTTGLNFFASTGFASKIEPDKGSSVTGPALSSPSNGAPVDQWSGIGILTPFGSGSFNFADSGSGDLVGIEALLAGTPDLMVPQGYVSGTSLSSTATYLNATFASLGISTDFGFYPYEWGTGENQNFTLHIALSGSPGPLPVPEPASIALLGTAI